MSFDEPPMSFTRPMPAAGLPTFAPKYITATIPQDRHRRLIKRGDSKKPASNNGSSKPKRKNSKSVKREYSKPWLQDASSAANRPPPTPGKWKPPTTKVDLERHSAQLREHPPMARPLTSPSRAKHSASASRIFTPTPTPMPRPQTQSTPKPAPDPLKLSPRRPRRTINASALRSRNNSFDSVEDLPLRPTHRTSPAIAERTAPSSRRSVSTRKSPTRRSNVFQRLSAPKLFPKSFRQRRQSQGETEPRKKSSGRTSTSGRQEAYHPKPQQRDPDSNAEYDLDQEPQHVPRSARRRKKSKRKGPSVFDRLTNPKLFPSNHRRRMADADARRDAAEAGMGSEHDFHVGPARGIPDIESSKPRRGRPTRRRSQRSEPSPTPTAPQQLVPDSEERAVPQPVNRTVRRSASEDRALEVQQPWRDNVMQPVDDTSETVEPTRGSKSPSQLRREASRTPDLNRQRYMERLQREEQRRQDRERKTQVQNAQVTLSAEAERQRQAREEEARREVAQQLGTEFAMPSPSADRASPAEEHVGVQMEPVAAPTDGDSDLTASTVLLQSQSVRNKIIRRSIDNADKVLPQSSNDGIPPPSPGALRAQARARTRTEEILAAARSRSQQRTSNSPSLDSDVNNLNNSARKPGQVSPPSSPGLSKLEAERARLQTDIHRRQSALDNRARELDETHRQRLQDTEAKRRLAEQVRQEEQEAEDSIRHADIAQAREELRVRHAEMEESAKLRLLEAQEERAKEAAQLEEDRRQREQQFEEQRRQAQLDQERIAQELQQEAEADATRERALQAQQAEAERVAEQERAEARERMEQERLKLARQREAEEERRTQEQAREDADYAAEMERQRLVREMEQARQDEQEAEDNRRRLEAQEAEKRRLQAEIAATEVRLAEAAQRKQEQEEAIAATHQPEVEVTLEEPSPASPTRDTNDVTPTVSRQTAPSNQVLGMLEKARQRRLQREAAMNPDATPTPALGGPTTSTPSSPQASASTSTYQTPATSLSTPTSVYSTPAVVQPAAMTPATSEDVSAQAKLQKLLADARRRREERNSVSMSDAGSDVSQGSRATTPTSSNQSKVQELLAQARERRRKPNAIRKQHPDGSQELAFSVTKRATGGFGFILGAAESNPHSQLRVKTLRLDGVSYQAGLREGDLLLTGNSNDLSSASVSTAGGTLNQVPVGEATELVVLRPSTSAHLIQGN
eukprot:m.218141 g.218141  ORF g.218141 m.218141 type:complete len:1202 (-) comp17215_c0_seq4:154-3759(-)